MGSRTHHSLGFVHARLEFLPWHNGLDGSEGIAPLVLRLHQRLTNPGIEPDFLLDGLRRSNQFFLMLALCPREESSHDLVMQGEALIDERRPGVQHQGGQERVALSFVEPAKMLGCRLGGNAGELQ